MLESWNCWWAVARMGTMVCRLSPWNNSSISRRTSGNRQGMCLVAVRHYVVFPHIFHDYFTAAGAISAFIILSEAATYQWCVCVCQVVCRSSAGWAAFAQTPCGPSSSAAASSHRILQWTPGKCSGPTFIKLNQPGEALLATKLWSSGEALC